MVSSGLALRATVGSKFAKYNNYFNLIHQASQHNRQAVRFTILQIAQVCYIIIIDLNTLL